MHGRSDQAESFFSSRTKLFIQTVHSTEIHRLIEEQAIDIGFAFTLHKSKSVISRPLYKEDMVLVCIRMRDLSILAAQKISTR